MSVFPLYPIYQLERKLLHFKMEQNPVHPFPKDPRGKCKNGGKIFTTYRISIESERSPFASHRFSPLTSKLNINPSDSNLSIDSRPCFLVTLNAHIPWLIKRVSLTFDRVSGGEKLLGKHLPVSRMQMTPRVPNVASFLSVLPPPRSIILCLFLDPCANVSRSEFE